MPKNENRVKVLTLLVLFVAAVLYLFMQKDEVSAAWAAMRKAGGQAVFTETGVKLTYNFDSAASFYAYNSENFYFCTKDGLKYMNGKGEPLWGDVFTMTAPVLVGGGPYALVAEPKGNVAYVYGPAGRLYASQFDGAIMYFTINQDGYATVTVKVEQDYETKIFNAEGRQVDHFVHQDSNIFPMCADVSGDGRVAVFSLLDINGAGMTSHIIARHLGKEASSYTDGIFAAGYRENEIVAFLKFLKDGNLFGFSDKDVFHIAVYDESPMDNMRSLALGNKIEQMGFFGEEGFVLALGDAFTNENGEAPGTLKFYNARGDETGAYALERKATQISCTRANVIVGTGRTYHAFSSKGKPLWQYSGTQDYKQVIFLENSDTVLFATNTEAVIMKRGK